MAKHIFAVLANCAEGADEDAFNDWYTNTHLADILSLPGYVKATRYELSSAQVMPDDELSHRYLAIYEIEADDIEAAVNALPASAEEVALAGWHGSETIDAASVKSWMFTQIAERFQSDAQS